MLCHQLVKIVLSHVCGAERSELFCFLGIRVGVELTRQRPIFCLVGHLSDAVFLNRRNELTCGYGDDFLTLKHVSRSENHKSEKYRQEDDIANASFASCGRKMRHVVVVVGHA